MFSELLAGLNKKISNHHEQSIDEQLSELKVSWEHEYSAQENPKLNLEQYVKIKAMKYVLSKQSEELLSEDYNNHKQGFEKLTTEKLLHVLDGIAESYANMMPEYVKALVDVVEEKCL